MPAFETHEAWVEALGKIAHAFELYPQDDRTDDEEREIDEGLQLFHEYYHYLR